MIKSDLVTLRNMVDGKYSFIVPVYQRLYVWGDEQVKTLLDDLLTAFQTEQEIFYLGGALVTECESTESGTSYELIDGQQRLTTLWMMSLAWKRALEPFMYYQQTEGIYPRVTFAIRPDINRFFTQRISGVDVNFHSNCQIVDALATIDSYLENTAREIDMIAFTQFIYDKVQMVLTRVPAHTDLNKLFEVINSRGVQLQHHEILKGKMLGFLPDITERERYALLWDAAASMDNYIEKNLREITGVKVTALYNDEASTNGYEDLANAKAVLEALSRHQVVTEQQPAIPLEAILTDTYEKQPDTGVSSDIDEDESCDVRSIISFPLLLQHVLRIWLHNHNQPDLPKIMDKELLSLFEQHFFTSDVRHDEVTSFIELLWEIRYCFDKYIIKWVTVGEEELHLINSLRLNRTDSRGKTYYSLVRQQPLSNDGFTLLQSMLYHSQQITTHYWLTPLLAYMHANPGQPAQHYAYLRHLENHLLCSTDKAPLIERSHTFLKVPWRSNMLDCSVLEQDLGVAFPHYWFYKLEFILWYLKRAEMKDDRWEAFRLTAKNSVEHISPQNPQATDVNRVSDRLLNSFGNLALVARSINSEYGNLPFNEKRQRFINRNSTRLDSLKMALIYDMHDQWNDTLVEQHQSEMIRLVKTYFSISSKDDTASPLTDATERKSKSEKHQISMRVQAIPCDKKIEYASKEYKHFLMRLLEREWTVSCPHLCAVNPTAYHPEVKRHCGRVGIHFFGWNWQPGVFGGVYFNTSNHRIPLIDPVGEADLAIFLEFEYCSRRKAEYSEDSMNKRRVFLAHENYQEICARLHSNSGDFHFTCEPPQTRWRLLVLQAPLQCVLSGTTTQEEQLECIYAAITQGINLITQDGLLGQIASLIHPAIL